MKKIIVYIIFILGVINAQNLPLLVKLDSPDFGDRYEALKTITDESLIEYIPELENRIFLQECFQLQFNYLKTLNSLGASNCYNLLNAFYNDIGIVSFDIDYDTYSNLEFKVLSNSIFFKYSDFNHVVDIFNYLTSNENKDYSILLNELLIVYNNLPNYREQVKSELLAIYNQTDSDYHIRGWAIEILSETDYYDINSLCINTITSISAVADLKIQCIKILYHNSYDGLRDLLRQNISIQESDFIRYQMVNHLLIQFGSPSDLYLVNNYYPNEPDQDTKTLIQFSLEDFIPPPPQMNTREYFRGYLINEIITPLMNYEWISPSISYDYGGAVQNLLEIMDRSNPFDYEEFCNLLAKEIIPQIEEDFENNELTIEGYKFLHYNFIYLLDQFNEEFQQNCSM